MKYVNFLWLIIIGVVANVGASQPPVNIKQKERDARKLITRAISHLTKNSIGKAAHDFTYNPAWRKGELAVILLGEEGECYTFGDEKSRIWTNFTEHKDLLGVPIIKRLLKSESSKGVSILLNNANMHLDVKRVKKDGKVYLVGAGFYPESPEFLVVDLVHRAIDLIRDVGLDSAQVQISNPHGFLVRGDSYVFVIREDGIIIAQGSDRARIGVDIFSPTDAAHSLINKHEFKKFFQSNVKEGWLAPIQFGGALNKIYAAKYIDPKTRQTYLVGSLYYPEITDDSVFSFVQKAIAMIKAKGKPDAFAEFNKPHGQFSVGGMRIIVFAPDGTCLANGEDADEVGYNLFGRLNERGHPNVQRIIEAAQREGRAWLNQWDKNAYKLIYAEKIDLPDGAVIVTSGYWPESKALAVKSMVERAVDFTQRNGKVAALERFTTDDSDFLRGDLHVTVLDSDGTPLAEGPYRKEAIWGDIKLRDLHGKKIVTAILDTASQGGGWVPVKVNNASYNAYVKAIEMLSPTGETENLVVATGYFI